MTMMLEVTSQRAPICEFGQSKPKWCEVEWKCDDVLARLQLLNVLGADVLTVPSAVLVFESCACVLNVVVLNVVGVDVVSVSPAAL